MKMQKIGDLHCKSGGDGPPLLLVHGFPLDHSMWNQQIEALAVDHQVIAPDLRGFGQSGGVGEITTMEQFADDMSDLLAALNIEVPVTFCGLSMGGYVAWQFFRRHRQRLSKLILCDTRAIADPPEVAQGRLDSAQRVVEEGVEFLVDGMIEKLFAPSTVENQPVIVTECRGAMMAAPPAGVAAALRGMAARPDSTSLLAEIDVPTLVICGQHDAISTVDEMQSIAKQISGARFQEVANAGHMSPLEDPTVVNRTIRDFISTI